MNVSIREILSYTINVVLVTGVIVRWWMSRKRDRREANFFNSAYDMAKRLANSLKENHASQQAQDLASFLKSATMNFMDKKRNEIDRNTKKQNFLVKWVNNFLNLN